MQTVFIARTGGFIEIGVCLDTLKGYALHVKNGAIARSKQLSFNSQNEAKDYLEKFRHPRPFNGA